MTTARQALRVARRCRVVVDNDWAGDPDGLVALAHHLLSPGNRVDAVTSSSLSPVFGSPAGTAAAGAALARELVALIDPAERPPVHAGGDDPFERGGAGSEASRAIVEQALRDDDLPLVVVCGGPLTNVAEALDAAPQIATRMALAWVGGSLHDAPEYNRDTDPAAARAVLAAPGLEVRQFPLETYRRCAYSVSELELDVGGCGELGAWLWERFLTLPLPEWVRVDPVWPLGDSAPLIGTALSDESSTWTVTPASPEEAARRVCTDLDVRLLVADMLALFRLHQARGA